MLIVSGQIGMEKDGSMSEDPLKQLEVALENVLLNLQAADMAPRDLLKLTFYHVGTVDVHRRRALVSTKLEGHKPCMTLLFVAALAPPNIKVEIDAVASRAG